MSFCHDEEGRTIIQWNSIGMLSHAQFCPMEKRQFLSLDTKQVLCSHKLKILAHSHRGQSSAYTVFSEQRQTKKHHNMAEPSPAWQVKQAHSFDSPSEGSKEQNKTLVTLEMDLWTCAKAKDESFLYVDSELMQECDVLAQISTGWEHWRIQRRISTTWTMKEAFS